MGKVIAGRVLVIIGFVLTMLTAIPLVLAVVVGLLTSDSTGHAFVPFLLLMVMVLPFILVSLIVAAVLALIGVILGGFRWLGVVTIVLAVLCAGALIVWTVGVDAGWF